jgi:3-phenylpropionate/trans-cinnamate dioxygenase ferredoxin reductase subunit
MNAKDSPDLSAGIPLADIPDGGMLGGHVGSKNVLVARRGDELFALSSKCTHYGGPLHEGLIAGDTIRCPWHHARFCLKTGEALAAPALDPVACWRVERDGDKVFVREPAEPVVPERKPGAVPESVVIVGGGAAGQAAAEMLRREGYDGPITMLSDDSARPCDRPNLSKDYLAGSAKPSWIPLRDEHFYRDQNIDLRLNTRVEAIDPSAKRVTLADDDDVRYDALLLATGAEPVRLDIPGGDLPHVRYLRTQADSEAIIGAVEGGVRRAVVIGGSFIGLEVAASLRQRDVEVHVVAPEARPLEKVMGAALAGFTQNLHESKGVVFHLGHTASAFEADAVTLDNGERLAADLIVVGIGVRPRTGIAEAAGLEVDNGVLVNEYLQTSEPGVYAAGDIARWPRTQTGEAIRVEHWVVAQRLGQAAARNILGAAEPFTSPPFFWSQHYDAVISYVGYAPDWDAIETDGQPGDFDFSARFIAGGRTLAVATIFRDVESLKAEIEMEAQRVASA